TPSPGAFQKRDDEPEPEPSRSICTVTSTTTQPTRTCDETSSPNFKYKVTKTCKDGYPTDVIDDDSDTTPSPKPSVIVVS
ncbi:33849_t:CDS:2, partial [Racocetra persica]